MQCKQLTKFIDGQNSIDLIKNLQDGVGEEKQCPDGLLFSDKVNFFTYPCQYPIDVNCDNRPDIQPPQPSEDCPHQFGYFRYGKKPAECSQFVNCVSGRSYIFECPEGLAFNSKKYHCDWPDLVVSFEN